MKTHLTPSSPLEAPRIPLHHIPSPLSRYLTILTSIVVVQSLSRVWFFIIPWTAAHQASLTYTISWSLLKLMAIELVMPSNHHTIPFSSCPQSFKASRSFPELALLIRWPKYWTFSFSISPSNEYSELISFRTDWFDLLAVTSIIRPCYLTYYVYICELRSNLVLKKWVMSTNVARCTSFLGLLSN